MEELFVKPASEQNHHPLRVNEFCFKGSHRACNANKGGKPEGQPQPTCICDCHFQAAEEVEPEYEE